MALTPRRATVTAETTTEFVIEVPLIVQGVNVKTKLDSLNSTAENLTQRVVVLEARPLVSSSPSGDYVPTSRTVNNHALTSNITITKSDLGLANVDNTSDSSKPVSTAQAAADAAVLVSANAYTDTHGGGGAATTLGHSWERPDPVTAGIGAVFINTDDGGEYVSSGTAPTNGVPLSGWMRRLPSGMAPTRAALINSYLGVNTAFVSAINTDQINLAPILISNSCSFAMHYYWNGNTAAAPYYVDVMLNYGQGNNFSDGASAFYYQPGGTGTIYLDLYTNVASTYITSVPAVAGYHTLVFAPVSYGGPPINHYWRWSYDGSTTADTPMTNPYVGPSAYNDFQAWGRSDGYINFGGKGIDMAVWTTLLTDADMAILSNPPAGTYGLLETASTGPAVIRIEANRFDSRSDTYGLSYQSMPIRGSNKPAKVYPLIKKVDLP